MGDRRFAATLAAMAGGSRPLLTIQEGLTDAAEPLIAAVRFLWWRLAITADGQAALAGEFDAVSRWPSARWLGGASGSRRVDLALGRRGAD